MFFYVNYLIMISCIVDTCGHDKFSCDGMCISKQWLCDGHADCKDQSDESSKLCGRFTGFEYWKDKTKNLFIFY